MSAMVKITLRTTMTYLIVGGFTPLALRSHALTGAGGWTGYLFLIWEQLRMTLQ